MENSPENTEKLIRYLDGELTGSELAEFEKLAAGDNAVRDELENLGLARDAVESYGLKRQVAGVHKEMMEEMSNGGKEATVRKMYPAIRTLLRIAAGLFIAFLSFGIYQYATVSSSDLYSDNYQPYKLSIARGGGNVPELEKDYISGDFKAAITAFEKLDRPAPKDYLLGGQAYMQTQQAPKAIAAFGQIIADNSADNIYKDDAEYYLAESYLENNEPLKAKPLFEKIYADKDHLYHDRVSYWTMMKLRILALKSPGK